MLKTKENTPGSCGTWSETKSSCCEVIELSVGMEKDSMHTKLRSTKNSRLFFHFFIKKTSNPSKIPSGKNDWQTLKRQRFFLLLSLLRIQPVPKLIRVPNIGPGIVAASLDLGVFGRATRHLDRFDHIARTTDLDNPVLIPVPCPDG